MPRRVRPHEQASFGGAPASGPDYDPELVEAARRAIDASQTDAPLAAASDAVASDADDARRFLAALRDAHAIEDRPAHAERRLVERILSDVRSELATHAPRVAAASTGRGARADLSTGTDALASARAASAVAAARPAAALETSVVDMTSRVRRVAAAALWIVGAIGFVKLAQRSLTPSAQSPTTLAQNEPVSAQPDSARHDPARHGVARDDVTRPSSDAALAQADALLGARVAELRRERSRLDAIAGDLARVGAEAGGPSSLLAELLIARSEGAGAHAFAPWLNDASRLAEAGPLERSIWIELLCDRYVLLGQHPLLLERLLDAPAAQLPAPLDELAEHASTRAQRLGLVAREAPSARSSRESGASESAVVSRSWVRELAAALPIVARRDPSAERWVASALRL